MKKVFCFLLFAITLLFLNNCSPIPLQWLNTIELSNVSVDNDASAINVEVSGYPPFIVEVYDNAFFEGTPTGSVELEEEGTSNLIGISSANPILWDPGKPLYLRARSKYGKSWDILGFIDDPTMILPVSGTLGTSTNPYLIETKEDLIAVSQKDIKYGGDSFAWYTTTNYLLINDIDLTGVVWQPIGYNMDSFVGIFDGGGHIISGVNSFGLSSLSSPSDDGFYSGFFGSSGGTIKNLGLKLGDVTISGRIYFGGLAGGLFSSGIVENCYVVGIGITGMEYAGGENDALAGLVGRPYGSATITNCYTDIAVTGDCRAGTAGLGGYMSSVTVRRCYAAGDVSYCGTRNLEYTGGFMGVADGGCLVEYCVALNERVVNKMGFSGLICFFGIASDVSSSNDGPFYYNKNMVAPDAVPTSISSIPINPFTMNQKTPPFDNWDFVNIWKWDAAINRPILRKVRQ